MKTQFNCEGLFPPSYLYGLELQNNTTTNLNSLNRGNLVQIHIIPRAFHLVVSVNSNGQITIDDSLYNVAHIQLLLPQLRLLYGHITVRNVQYNVPQSQGCTNLCGFFSIAKTYLLLSGVDPGCRQHDMNTMRQHLYQCILNGEVTAFPVISSSRIKKTVALSSSNDELQKVQPSKLSPAERKRKSHSNEDVYDKQRESDRKRKKISDKMKTSKKMSKFNNSNTNKIYVKIKNFENLREKRKKNNNRI